MTDEFGKAQSFAREGRLEEALKMCFKAIEKSPQDVEARSLAMSLSGQLNQFVEWSHQLLELADLFKEQAQHDKALALLDQFLELPMDGRPSGERNLHTLLQRQVFFLKGQIHRDCRRPQQAERNFRESLTLGPDRWQTYLELGRILICLARYQEAAQVLQDGRRLSPGESGQFMEALGDVYHQLGRDARSCYEEAVGHYKNQSRSADVLRVSARLLELFGDKYLQEILESY
jgi:tetratricopeptide (TPR) repeat protein